MEIMRFLFLSNCVGAICNLRDQVSSQLSGEKLDLRVPLLGSLRIRPLPACCPIRLGRGFTLVELLIAVAVVGTMVSLLLPAVQAAREKARTVTCKNNLKQLALASYNHHDTQGHFPTGGWGWYWVGDPDRGYGKEQPGGWIYNLLPYYEKADLHDLASDGDPDFPTRHQQRMAGRVINSPLDIINCPSRRANTVFPMTKNDGGSVAYFNSLTPKTAGRSDYAMNSGHVYNEWTNVILGRGPRSYHEAKQWTALNVWGSQQRQWLEIDGELTMTGISFERSLIGLHQIRDGTSRTYVIGERYISQSNYETGYDRGDNETWCTGFNNDNYRKTGRIEGSEIVELLPVNDAERGKPEINNRFGAAHPDIWNVAFCDGSVRSLTYDIDWKIHQDLGNRNDGRSMDPQD